MSNLLKSCTTGLGPGLGAMARARGGARSRGGLVLVYWD